MEVYVIVQGKNGLHLIYLHDECLLGYHNMTHENTIRSILIKKNLHIFTHYLSFFFSIFFELLI